MSRKTLALLGSAESITGVPKDEIADKISDGHVKIYMPDILQDAVPEWAFFFESGLCHIGPLGAVQTLKQTLGLFYLHYLLRYQLLRPCRSVPATDLVFSFMKPTPEMVAGSSPRGDSGTGRGIQCVEDGNFNPDGIPSTNIRGEGFGIKDDFGLDDKYLKDVRKAISDLQDRRDELAASDGAPSAAQWNPGMSHEDQLERIEDLDEQIAWYRSFLDKETRLDGKLRPLLDARLEKCRKSAWADINRALRAIQDIHPEIAAHLRKYVKTGNELIYEPFTEMRWILSPPDHE